MVRALLALLLSLALAWYAPSAEAVAPEYKFVSGTITSSQVQNMHTTGVVIIPAGGANTIQVPIKAYIYFDYIGTAYTGSGGINARWVGGPTGVAVLTNGQVTGTSDIQGPGPSNLTLGSSNTDVRNAGIELVSSAALSTGTGTIHYEVIYFTATTNH